MSKLSEEVRIKLDNLQEEYNKKAYDVLLQEANNNNPYKVGDIVEDHYQTGIIKSIITGVDVFSRSCEISYSCARLTKQLNPYRDGETTVIHLCNVKRKLN